MGASPTPRIAEVRPLVAVAYSGGRDSTALLHATAVQARSRDLRVAGLHVHHGLSPLADAWVAHCRGQCEAWAAEGLPVEFHHVVLQGAPTSGESREAWARKGRHTALAAMVKELGGDLLLLAQHRRDQAETFLLQALRAAGPAGLAAMPASQWRNGICWARPWLAQPREAIEAYLKSRGLNYIDDPSNADASFARNRLRLQVWPSMGRAFDGLEPALAQSAEWAQQALELQTEMAEQDLATTVSEGGLAWCALQALSPARRMNALRAWLQGELGQAAPATLVRRLAVEAVAHGEWPAPGGRLRLYRGQLSFAVDVTGLPLIKKELTADLSRPGEHRIAAWHGSWHVSVAEQGGIAASALTEATMRPRQGGEQFQAAGMPRSLKKCFQSAGVPAWQRAGPLLYCTGQLSYVPGLGLDRRAQAPSGSEQRLIEWRPEVGT
ncbi:MAG TPA: tRNA lysidine(34) synthetase TilS [Burkholderiaceae bacterium]